MADARLDSTKQKPRIWVLLGSKGGDNSQVLRAARAMRLPFEVRKIVMRPEFETGKPIVAPSLQHIDRAASDHIDEPWPDLTLAIGRRLSMVALWIKKMSGGVTKIALLGAPKGGTEQFDLVIAPGFYKVGQGSGICSIALPLLGVEQPDLDMARSRFADSIGTMPRPLDALMLGGSTNTLRLEPSFARNIVEKMIFDKRGGGSLYVTTSRRTHPGIADALRSLLRPADRIFTWSPDAPDNPYLGLLALGDRFTVTGDSISMIVEVARLARPLVIVELPHVNARLLRAAKMIGLRNPNGQFAKKFLEIGTRGQVRDFDRLYGYLYKEQIAVPFGERPVTPISTLPDDTATVGRRLRLLAGVSD